MDLRRRNCLVTIQSQAAGQDADGQPNGAWATYDTRWANILNGTGAEAIRGGAQASTRKSSIRFGYCTDLTTAMQITHGGVTYQILAVLPDLTRRKHTDVVCEVIV